MPGTGGAGERTAVDSAPRRSNRTESSSRRRVLTGASTSLLGGCASTLSRSGPSEDDATYDDSRPLDDELARVGFTGDVMLGRNLDDRYGAEERDGTEPPAAVWGDVLPRLEALDGLFVNLECCLTTRGERFPDRTYYFRADPAWAVPALQRAGVRWTSLANNHVLDFGERGLRDTIAALSDGDVAHSGAGETPEAARTPALVSVGSVDVALVSFADHHAEYAATDDRPGTAYVECNPNDPRTRRIVTDALDRASALDPDLIVASLHWGPNWVEYPDDRYRAFGRWLIDRGVTLVHGHSAHVVQGVEAYGGGVILHDTGDFVDDYVVKEDLRNDRSVLFEVVIDADGSIAEVRLVPIEIDDLAVHPAGSDAGTWIREAVRERSTPFGTSFERDDETLVVDLACDLRKPTDPHLYPRSRSKRR